MRALRRARSARAKRVAAQRLKLVGIKTPSAVQIGRKACTPKLCSCFMCGNPRRYWKTGLTVQERRADRD